MNPSEPRSATTAGEQLLRTPCDFAFGVADLTTLPTDDRPEVCFAGRSNVGKSSLLNAMLGRRALARTSNTPGRTRELNFYNVDDRMWLVDLPGYGYAVASKRDIAAWQRLTQAYLSGRPTLRRVFVLIDARRGVGELDDALMTTLDQCGVNHRWVLTKIDKLKSTEQDRPLAALAPHLAKHPAAHPHPLVTSARTYIGLAELREDVAMLAGLS